MTMNQDNIFGEVDNPEVSEFKERDLDDAALPEKPKSNQVKKLAVYAGVGMVTASVLGILIWSNLQRFGVIGKADNPITSAPVFIEPSLPMEQPHADPLSPEGFTQMSAQPTPIVELATAEQSVSVDEWGHPSVMASMMRPAPEAPTVSAPELKLIQDTVADLAKRLEEVEISRTLASQAVSNDELSEIKKQLAILLEQQASLQAVIADMDKSVKTQKKQIDNAQANARLALTRTNGNSSGSSQRATPSAVAPTAARPAAPQPNYVLKAIVQNQAWLQNEKGETVPVTSADSLPGFGRPTTFDTQAFTVCFENKRCIGG